MTDDISQVGELPPFGAVLAATRNAKSLSLQDVSDTLRLSVKQISALENDDFSALPQPMVTRGFIRNYARLLELDAQALLDSYRLRVPDNTTTSLNVQTSIPHVQLVKQNRPWLKYVLALLLLVLVVWYYQAEQAVSPSATPAAVSEVVSAVALPEAALPSTEPEADVVGSSAGELAVNPVASDKASSLQAKAVQPTAIQSVATVESVASSVMQKDKPTLIPAPANVGLQLRPSSDMTIPSEVKLSEVKQATTIGRALLTLSATDKAWVQVKDKAGAVLYEKMLAANSNDSLEAQPPLYLWLGNAKATSLSYMGKSVDVSSKTINNTARLTLE